MTELVVFHAAECICEHPDACHDFGCTHEGCECPAGWSVSEEPG